MNKTNQTRLVMLFPTAMLGSFIVSFFHICWITFWLTQDVGQTAATITNEKSHGVVNYSYTINGNQYIGQSQRNREEKEKVPVGGRTLVYFSTSHPWLSSLQAPTFPPPGMIVFIISLAMEFLFVMTVINPKGKWALQIGLKEND